jgi:predicted nucleic acid-binding protein
MGAVLFDTSIWIDYLNGKKHKFSDMLDDYIRNEKPVLTCPIIIQEILQGVKSDDDYVMVKESILSFEILTIDPIEAAVGAAELYRSLRKKGITIRKSNDCLIAFYAIQFKAVLVHKDSDFDRIAKENKNLNVYK